MLQLLEYPESDTLAVSTDISSILRSLNTILPRKKKENALRNPPSFSRVRTRVEFATHLSFRPRESDLMRIIDEEEEGDVYDADDRSGRATVGHTASSTLTGFHA